MLRVALVAMVADQPIGMWEDTAAEEAEADADDDIEPPASLRPTERIAFWPAPFNISMMQRYCADGGWDASLVPPANPFRVGGTTKQFDERYQPNQKQRSAGQKEGEEAKGRGAGGRTDGRLRESEPACCVDEADRL